jgi:lysyl endopeptidase
VGLSPIRLPKGAELYLSDPDRRLVRGPYTDADVTNGELWTPLVKGDELILELEVPQEQRSATDLVVESVTHGYRSLDSSPISKSGACNLDVACDEADPWRNQVRSVGGYTLQRDRDALFCSGTLINNTARDGRPLFLTAEHCVSEPSDATSMVFYWNFETNSCRDPGTTENGTFPSDSLTVGDWDQTSTGAVLRARYGNVHSTEEIAGKSDLTLVEIEDSIPEEYDLYLSGWSRTGNTTQESVAIHHPSGHGKRITFDRDPSSLIDYPSSLTCNAPQGDTHLLVENWEVGTTEPGSSGSPLFDNDQHVVGVLSGGCAGCGGNDGTEDNNRPDWYGRIAPGFENGDYTPPDAQEPTTLADVLDPIDSGSQELKGRFLKLDSIPPAPISNFEASEVSPDTVTLQWEAPGDDELENGPAERYDLRYQTSTPIQSWSDFQSARSVSNTPRPQSPGALQSVSIPVNPDTSYYFALVAYDEQSNASSLVATDRDITPVSALRVTTPPSPNPARERVTIRFVVEEKQTVEASLYDALGRRVQILHRGEVRPFRQQTLQTSVSSLSSGIFFLRLRGETAARTEQIAVVK